MTPDFEAILRGVPCRECGLFAAEHIAGTPDPTRHCAFVPSFPAMAQAVREAVEQEQRSRLEEEYFMGDTATSYEEWLMERLDAARAEVDQLQKREGVRDKNYEDEIARLRAEIDGLRKLAAVDAETMERYAREVERLRAAAQKALDELYALVILPSESVDFMVALGASNPADNDCLKESVRVLTAALRPPDAPGQGS